MAGEAGPLPSAARTSARRSPEVVDDEHGDDYDTTYDTTYDDAEHDDHRVDEHGDGIEPDAEHHAEHDDYADDDGAADHEYPAYNGYDDEHYEDDVDERVDGELGEGVDEDRDADLPGHASETVVAAPVGRETARVVQDGPAPTRAQLRIDFGAHLEANYRRLVAQLYAITLDPAEAHAVVQDAYSRAWRSWAAISRSPDPTGWVRRVAVRSTIRSWRRWRRGTRRPVGGSDARTTALLTALGRLPAPERRCVVLHHMAGSPVREIASVEGVSVGTTVARLARAQQVVTDGLTHVLVDGFEPDEPLGSGRWAAPGWAATEWDGPPPATPGAVDDEEDPR